MDCVPAHQGLARLFARLGNVELAAAAASMLELFGAADADAIVQARTLEEAVPPPGKMDLRQLALSPELRLVAAI